MDFFRILRSQMFRYEMMADGDAVVDDERNICIYICLGDFFDRRWFCQTRHLVDQEFQANSSRLD